MEEIIHYIDMLGLLLASLVMASIAFYVYFQNRRSLVNRSFSYLCAVLCLWTVGSLLRHIINVPEVVLFLHRLTHTIGSAAIFCTLYFALIFPRGKDISNLAKMFLYLPSFFFSVVAITTNLMVRGLFISNVKYYYLAKIDFGPVETYYNIYSAFYLLAMLSVIIFKLIRSKGLEKIKLSFILAAFFIGAISGVLFTLWLPELGVQQLDSFGHTSIIIGLGLISYTIIRYKLFIITPQVAAAEILLALKNSAQVYNLEGKVLYSYEEMKPLNKDETGEIIKRTVERGSLSGYKVFLGDRPYSVSASFFKEGGGIAVMFYDLTEIEEAEERERSAHERLVERLEREKKIGIVLNRMSSLSKAGTTLKSAEGIFKKEPESVKLALEHMVGITQKRKEMLEKLIKEKEKVEKELIEISRIHRESMEREFKILELRDKIKAVKKNKG